MRNDNDFAILIHRLSTRPSPGIMDAIRSLITVAEFEQAKHEIEDALRVVGERRPLRKRTFMEWMPDGWREIM